MPQTAPGSGKNLLLPTGFLHGIASAATVIESREPLDGQLSIWDVFAAAPGRVTDGSLPRSGPRHLAHWSEDLDLLAALGVNAYRMSLPWSAMTEPGGPALDFYDQLVDGLLERRIAPIVTLTHFEMPLDVMERGGWLVSATAEEFALWAGRVASRLADRVYAWVTMNAPLVHTAFGYGLGIEAPGLTLLGGALHAAQNQLIGHGLAVAALRGAHAGKIGIANSHTRVSAATDSAADTAAAALYDALHNRAFTDPLVGRSWPVELTDLPGAPGDELSDDHRALIAAPLDFYGINYYYPQRVEHAPQNVTIPFAFVDPTDGERMDEFGWPIDPAALTTVLTDLRERYPTLPQFWVTETGTQDGGGLDDTHRGRYITDHLGAVAAAIAAGVDVGGFFYWSLLDGWEFAEGLTRKFGLVAVDPLTARRSPKQSYQIYRDLLGS